MRFEFTLVEGDWPSAELKDDAGHVTIPASPLSDCLGDVLHAVWRSLQGETETRCNWLVPPDEYRWILRRDGNDVTVRVLQAAALSQQPDEASQLVFETRMPLTTFARAIALGTSRTLAEHGESGYRDLSGMKPFPTRTLELIQAELRR